MPETYITIRLKTFFQEGKLMKILSFVDVTTQIQYMEIKAQSEFSSLINTIMSHELRNPLNSIIAKNIEKSALYQKMVSLLNQFDETTKETPGFKSCLEILDKVGEGKKIQQNSAQLMNYIIQNSVDYAQIKGNNFRQHYKDFNIRDAIEEVMSIQRQKALDKNLEFNVNFINIGFIDNNIKTNIASPIINGDEHRIMQVL